MFKKVRFLMIDNTLSITCICQDHSRRNLLGYRVPNLLQGNLWLGLKLNPFRNTRFFTAFRIFAPYFRQV
jgi:hypothetical protein